MGHFACFLLIDHVFSDQIDLQIDPRHVLMYIYFTATHIYYGHSSSSSLAEQTNLRVQLDLTKFAGGKGQ
jgi:hypothetical protein